MPEIKRAQYIFIGFIVQADTCKSYGIEGNIHLWRISTPKTRLCFANYRRWEIKTKKQKKRVCISFRYFIFDLLNGSLLHIALVSLKFLVFTYRLPCTHTNIHCHVDHIDSIESNWIQSKEEKKKRRILNLPCYPQYVFSCNRMVK